MRRGDLLETGVVARHEAPVCLFVCLLEDQRESFTGEMSSLYCTPTGRVGKKKKNGRVMERKGAVEGEV